MPKSEIFVAEQESPVLTLNHYWQEWRTKAGRVWACHCRLTTFFEIDESDIINFVAKARADRSTYKVKVVGGEFPRLIEPEHAPLPTSLAAWLKKQINAGRPHIGVRVCK